MAGTIGLVQNDIKRVLGVLDGLAARLHVPRDGRRRVRGGIFHLYTHAFFKALLFLGSGAVIHALHGEQDLRHMGGLQERAAGHVLDVPRSATLAIAGVPLLSGFFSKDEILGKTFASGHTMLWAVGVAHGVPDGDVHVPAAVSGLLRRAAQAPAAAAHGDGHGAALSAAGHGRVDAHLHDAPPAMAIRARRAGDRRPCWPATSACRASLGGGERFDHYLAPSFQAPTMASIDGALTLASPAAKRRRPSVGQRGTEMALMGVSVVAALGGIGSPASSICSARASPTRSRSSLSGLYALLLGKYFVDEIYDAVIVQPIKRVSTRPVERHGRRPHRRHGEQRRLRRAGGSSARVAPPPDRFGARVCDVALRRRRRDRGVFPVAMTGIDSDDARRCCRSSARCRRCFWPAAAATDWCARSRSGFRS